MATIDSGHEDMVHDVQLDYYGRRLATCSSDTTIKVFDVLGEQLVPTADLRGHQGPVFAVAWGHPKYGNILASCGFDNRVIIWKEEQQNMWSQIYVSSLHTASVNSLSFAPHELGFLLASASSDGSIGIISQHLDGSFAEDKIADAHPVGATGVSWAPAIPAGSAVSAKAPTQPDKRFCSSGCDNAVKVWRWSQQSGWQQDGGPLLAHRDWVRDVAWAPNMGLPMSTIASAGQDGRVFIWEESDPGSWKAVNLPDFQAAVFRVSWSVTGNILAVSDSSNSVSLWKEGLDKQWQQISS